MRADTFKTPKNFCFLYILSLLLMFNSGVAAHPLENLTLEERGARHGQALAAARFCPGAKLSEKAEKLKETLNQDEILVFTKQSENVLISWEKAFLCTDVDPAQTREINGCRKAKILSCTTTWKEIGPEGTAFQGLLEFKPE